MSKNINGSITKYIKEHWRGLLCVCISTLFLMMTLLPFIRLAMYSIPYYDDYNFGLFTKNALEVKKSFASVITAFFTCGYSQWLSWQGPYSCSAFSALTGQAFGEKYYFIGPTFIVLFLVLSVFVFIYNFLKYLFKAADLNAVALSIIISGLLINLIHVPNEGLYWFNGGIAYVGMFSFECLLFTGIIRIIFVNKKTINNLIRLIVVCVLAFIVAGANYVTALQVSIIMASVIVILFIANHKFGKVISSKDNSLSKENGGDADKQSVNNAVKIQLSSVAIVATVYYIGFMLNLIAPGNANRSSDLTVEGIDPANAIVQSFVYAFTYSKYYFGKTMFLVILFVITPLIVNMIKKSDFDFKKPWLLLIWSTCLYATSFTPGLFALGNPGAGRTINVIKFMYLLLIVINYIYLIGALTRFIKTKKYFEGNSRPAKIVAYCNKCANCDKLMVQISKVALYFVISLFLIIAVFVKTDNRVVSYPSFGAYYYIKSGIAANFKTEYDQRIEILKSDEKNVVVNKYNYIPTFLLVNDLSEDPTNEMNQYIARWYEKNSVICK